MSKYIGVYLCCLNEMSLRQQEVNCIAYLEESSPNAPFKVYSDLNIKYDDFIN